MNIRIAFMLAAFVLISGLMTVLPEADAAEKENLCSKGQVLSDTALKSVEVLVNKKYTIDAKYKPSDLVTVDIRFASHVTSDRKKLRKEAAGQLEKLFAAMEKADLEPIAISGYRSYQAQKWLFEKQLEKKKNFYAANRTSACAGQSEHQTGLAMDVSSTSFDGDLGPGFAKTDEYKWLVKYAHQYGYVIRYPKDGEEITGYTFEPWHIRYVGKELAELLKETKWTLEEYDRKKKAGKLKKKSLSYGKGLIGPPLPGEIAGEFGGQAVGLKLKDISSRKVAVLPGRSDDRQQ